MLRILAFFVVVLAIALGFYWLAENPGSVSFVWLGREIDTSMTVFLVALVALIVAVLIVVALLRGILSAPGALGGWWRGRRREHGYDALSTGIVAAGAGDAVLARRMSKRAEKLLSGRNEPLVGFLDAQTAMIEGDHERAKTSFEAMEHDPQTELLALRGMYLESERTGDAAATRYYAERAVRIAPHVPWAGGAVLEAKALAGEWDGALDILEAQQNTQLIDRAEAKRLRAVLLTGKAMDLLESEPDQAKKTVLRAHKLVQDFVPAALVAAEASYRAGDPRRARKTIETTWKSAPHPHLAEAYLDDRSGDTAADKLKRARRLAGMQPESVEADMCLSRAALDAGEFDLARDKANAAADKADRESICLLLADIEDAQTGDVARVREWLARALRAGRDPAWTADGMVSAVWAPVSPITGRLDAYEWKVPVERTGEARSRLIKAAEDAHDGPALATSGDMTGSKPSIEGGSAKPTGTEPEAGKPEPREDRPKALTHEPETVEPETSAKAASDRNAAKAPAKKPRKQESDIHLKAQPAEEPPTPAPPRTQDEQPAQPAPEAADETQERGWGHSSKARKKARFG